MIRKVALLGNMNNNLFNLTRYLRDWGFEATLFILPYDPVHFLPEADSFDTDFKSFVKTLHWGNPYELGKTSSAEIRLELSRYDFIIGCGTSPAYLSLAGINLDLFTPYGSDLYHYPFYNLFNPRKIFSYLISLFKRKKEMRQLPSKPANIRGYIPFIRHQRRGIKGSSGCAVLTSGEDVYGIALKKLDYRNRHFHFTVPMVYAPQYNKESIVSAYAKSDWYAAFEKIRANYDFLIFHNCRHCWKYEEDPASFKGNDRLLKGFAQFIKSYPGRSAIITFEYGTDFQESRNLCKELEIIDDVYWFPLMPRKELMIGMSLCDLVAGNLSDMSWATYGVVYESMALSKPIMHHREDALYASDTLYPMINAYSTETVSNCLLYYSSRRGELAEIGSQANQWFLESCVDAPIREIAALINAKKID